MDMAPRQKDYQEESLHQKVDRLQRLVEAGLSPEDDEFIQTRQVARTINDTKKAHEKLDAKVLDCINALQNIRTQDKGQVKIWFEEWQTEVDAFTTWIYRQENALEDEIERQENAVSPKTSRRRARL